MFHHTQTLCLFYLSFVFKTCVSTLKKKEVFPQNSDLSSFCLIIPPRSISHLRLISHFQLTLHYCTIPNLHLTLLGTTPGDHSTAPEPHPLEPHRTYTQISISTDLCCVLGTSFWSPPQGSFPKLVPSIHRMNPPPFTHIISEAAIAHVASHPAPYIHQFTTPLA